MVYEYPVITKPLDEKYSEINFPDFDAVSEVETKKLVKESKELLQLLILNYQDENKTLPKSSNIEGEDIVKIKINSAHLRDGVIEYI